MRPRKRANPRAIAVWNGSSGLPVVTAASMRARPLEVVAHRRERGAPVEAAAQQLGPELRLQQACAVVVLDGRGGQRGVAAHPGIGGNDAGNAIVRAREHQRRRGGIAQAPDHAAPQRPGSSRCNASMAACRSGPTASKLRGSTRRCRPCRGSRSAASDSRPAPARAPAARTGGGCRRGTAVRRRRSAPQATAAPSPRAWRARRTVDRPGSRTRRCARSRPPRRTRCAPSLNGVLGAAHLSLREERAPSGGRAGLMAKCPPASASAGAGVRG